MTSSGKAKEHREKERREIMRKISSLALAKTMAGLLLVSALGAGTAHAASTVAHNGLLDQQEAAEFAFMDADVKADEVTNLRTHLEKDDGVYVYDIEFYVGNIEYEYEIRAEDGVVLEKDKEDKSRNVKTDTAADSDGRASSEEYSGKEENSAKAADQTADQAVDETADQTADQAVDQTADQNAKGTSDPANEQPLQESAEDSSASSAADNKYISVDRAKQIALQDAGLEEEEVIFTAAKFEDDDGRKEYDIEFYCGSLEYEYEIDAMTGRILDSDVETEND